MRVGVGAGLTRRRARSLFSSSLRSATMESTSGLDMPLVGARGGSGSTWALPRSARWRCIAASFGPMPLEGRSIPAEGLCRGLTVVAFGLWELDAVCRLWVGEHIESGVLCSGTSISKHCSPRRDSARDQFRSTGHRQGAETFKLFPGATGLRRSK